MLAVTLVEYDLVPQGAGDERPCDGCVAQCDHDLCLALPQFGAAGCCDIDQPTGKWLIYKLKPVA